MGNQVMCQFDRLLFPKTREEVTNDSYMIALYSPCEQLVDGTGARVYQVKAVGYCLPLSDKIRYKLQGYWSKTAKYGVQFNVENYDEVIEPTQEGIIAYLSSGQIYGIGRTIAERVYERFGESSLDILDKDPDRLLAVSGISPNKLEKIKASYLEHRGARDVVAFLAPHGITANKAVKIYQEYGSKALDILKNNPYRLCEMAGIGFQTADKIAIKLGMDKMSHERMEAALLYATEQAENEGHLCMERRKLVLSAMSILETPEITEEMLKECAMDLMDKKEITCYGAYAYRTEMAREEAKLARLIIKQLENSSGREYDDIDAEIDYEERKLKIRFAPEQREAIKLALTKGLAVITGGPGTGKTLIQRAILDIYAKNYSGAIIRCCAPTGRAARRMSQSTGRGACTIHRLLCLSSDDDGNLSDAKEIDGDLVLVDEISMLDVHLAVRLFKSIKDGAQLILIGDADQLPSVGPGAVLSEILASGAVPCVRLDKVFRQSSDSRIAVNAKLIRHGNLNLEYGDDFRIIESKNLDVSANRIVDLYLEEVEKYGLDNVVLLTPLRKRTKTCVNDLNALIQAEINPPKRGKCEAKVGTKIFREGDKVMQTKNHEEVNNGDIGYVKQVYLNGTEATVEVDFGDGRVKLYEGEDLNMLDLGYASTVHKSQGSEYSSVIISLQMAHSIMLTRPLIYTAVTRGKSKVIIVGERQALCVSIKKLSTEKRATCLAERIKEIINK